MAPPTADLQGEQREDRHGDRKGDLRADLRADCGRCVGLCCVALPFTRSADFAIDKPEGVPCPNLLRDNGCRIHARLASSGFPGCAAFDCFGAGQQLTQVTFGGASWRDGSSTAEAMFAAFAPLRAVQEMRWYLADARCRSLAPALAGEVRRVARELDAYADTSGPALARLDVDGLRGRVGELLRRVSTSVRARGGRAGRDLSRADLSGQSWRGADLRWADLRGALLLGADLRAADLRGADLLGSDLRGADLRGADLSDAVFLTGPQLAAATGDGGTRIPAWCARPGHWL